VPAGSGWVAATADGGGAGDADGFGALAPGLDVSAVPDDDVLAGAGDWTLTEASPLEQPAATATAVSKQPPSRALLRLPTTDLRSIDTEVDIPATLAQHIALCRGGNGGSDTGPTAPGAINLLSQHSLQDGPNGRAGRHSGPFILGGWPAFYWAADLGPLWLVDSMRTITRTTSRLYPRLTLRLPPSCQRHRLVVGRTIPAGASPAEPNQPAAVRTPRRCPASRSAAGRTRWTTAPRTG
jgi:hypothetical protein